MTDATGAAIAPFDWADCPLCHGMGEVHRESLDNYRLFAWPCPTDCTPGLVAFVRTTVTPDRARKMAAKAARLAEAKR